MDNTTKIIIPIAIVLIALIAIFFLAPMKAWKEMKKQLEGSLDRVYVNIKAPDTNTISYPQFCLDYWKDKFTGTVNGGVLPEIKITATKK